MNDTATPPVVQVRVRAEFGGQLYPVWFPPGARHLESLCGPVSHAARLVVTYGRGLRGGRRHYRVRRLLRRLRANGYARTRVECYRPQSAGGGAPGAVLGSRREGKPCGSR